MSNFSSLKSDVFYACLLDHIYQSKNRMRQIASFRRAITVLLAFGLCNLKNLTLIYHNEREFNNVKCIILRFMILNAVVKIN